MMYACRVLMLLLVTLLLAGCQLELPPTPLGRTTALDAPFTLMLGESIAVDGEPVTIRLERWIEDHRCPAGQECAEPGPVRLQITLWREGRPMTYPVFVVRTDQDGAVVAALPGDQVENKVGPYRIRMTAVTPFPDADGVVTPDAYRATLVLTKDPTARPDTDADMVVLTDNPFTLAPGEQVTVVGAGIVLRVEGVTDTRCPVGATCTAEGLVTVDLSLQEGETTRQVQISAATDAAGRVLPPAGVAQGFALVDGVGIRLASVTPRPASAAAPAQGDYRVTVILEPGPRLPYSVDLAEAGEPFSLTPDHTAIIGQDEVRVRFDQVLQDFRCPRTLLCVQAGEVTVAVTVASTEMRATSYMLAGATETDGTLLEPAEITHGGYTLRLLQVTPYPEGAASDIPADAYVATFAVEAPAGGAAPPTTAAPGATAAPDAGLRPLLCVNSFAVTRMNIGGAAEPAIQFTDPLPQDAATDYGAAHALCNRTFGLEWVQAGPSDLANFAAYLPAGADFWVWDGMAGGLVRYTP